MQVHLEKGRLWFRVTGTAGELTSVIDMLTLWSKQLDVKSRRQPVYLGRETELEVLGGAMAYLVSVGVLNCPEAWPALELAGSWERRTDALHAQGLLRRYQADAVLHGLRGPWGRAIVDVAMGGGKTRICAGLAAVAGGRWLYLVQNQELARQSERSFEELLPQMLKVTGETGSMTATTYAGIKRLESLEFMGVAVDEVHCVAARDRSLAYAELQAHHRVGLSGTPLDRQDSGNALVAGLLGPVVYRVDVGDLEKQGFLSRGEVRRLVFDHRDGKLRPL